MGSSARELLPAILIAAAIGVLAVTVNPFVLLVGAALAAVVLVGMLWRGARTADRAHSPMAFALVAVAVLASAWIGVRGPAQVPIADLPFLLAIPLVAIAAVTRRGALPMPPWLLYVAGALLISALLPIMFVINQPPKVLAEQSAVTLGATSSRASALALLARMEYALVLVPVVVGAVAATWSRTRLLADLWVASAAICALVGCLDRLAGTGIGPSLVGNLEGLQLGQRATGLTAHPNYLGLFAAMAVPVSITRAFQTRGLGRLAALAATVILMLGVQLSGSRLGVVTVFLAVALLFALVPRFRLGIALGVAALSLAVLITLGALPAEESALGRLGGSSATQGATDARFRAIDKALDNGLSHPLTGIGFDRIFDSHSIPVQFLQAGGIIALAALLLWWFGMGRLGWLLSRDRNLPPPARELAAALTAALIAWLVTGVINPQISERFLFIPAGLLLGLGLVAARSRETLEAAADPAEPRLPKRSPATTRDTAPEPAPGAMAGAAGAWAPRE